MWSFISEFAQTIISYGILNWDESLIFYISKRKYKECLIMLTKCSVICENYQYVLQLQIFEFPEGPENRVQLPPNPTKNRKTVKDPCLLNINFTKLIVAKQIPLNFVARQNICSLYHGFFFTNKFKFVLSKAFFHYLLNIYYAWL